MAVKLIAVDMDGTLLNDEKRVTEETSRALRRAVSAGFEVVFCTGRTLVELDDAMQALPEVRYAVCSSGGSIRDLHAGRVLHSCCFSPETGRMLVERLLRFDGMVAVFAGGRACIQESWRERIFEVFPPILAQYNARYYAPKPNLTDYAAGEFGPVEKIFSIFVSEQERNRAWDAVREVACEQAASTLDNLELNASGATKGNGLRRLSEMLGVRREEVLAIGDSGNDRTMLEYAGVPAVVGNADAEIRPLARLVLPTNEENGVAWALNKLLEGNLTWN